MKLKNTMLALAVTVATLGAGAPAAFAWEMPGMGADAETASIKDSSGKLMTRVYHATRLLLESSAVLQRAAGNKVELEKIESTLKQLSEGKPDDPQTLKAVAGSVTEISSGLAKAKFDARKLSAEEKSQLVNGLLNAGVAGVFDAAALKEAKDLADKTTSVIKNAASNPMKLASLKDVADSAKFVADFVPAQAASVKSLTESLGKYAKANGIPVPSAEDIKKAAEKVQKE